MEYSWDIIGWLVVYLPTPLKNIWVKVSWDDYSIPKWIEKVKIMFQTTNQIDNPIFVTLYNW